MRRLASKALSRVESLLDHPDPKVQLTAIDQILKLSSDLQSRPTLADSLMPDLEKKHESRTVAWIEDHT